MRAIIQRVEHASVTVGDEMVGRIDAGLLVLLGVTHDDILADATVLASKIIDLRVFDDADVRFDRSIRDVGGSMLVVSQFTLYGTARKGRRPSFSAAASGDMAEPLVDGFVEAVRAEGITAATGRFGALMQVDLCNSGPVTLVIEATGGRIVS